MLKYLINYDIDIDVELDLDFELDITDKTILQDQINNVRKSYRDLIDVYSKIQGEYLSAKEELANLNRRFLIEYPNRNERLNEQGSNQEYLYLQMKIEALQESMRSVNSQLDYIKSDIRILNSSMYSR